MGGEVLLVSGECRQLVLVEVFINGITGEFPSTVSGLGYIGVGLWRATCWRWAGWWRLDGNA